MLSLLLSTALLLPAQDKSPVEYLRSLQADDGSFAPGGLRATTSAVRALGYFGGAPRDREAAAKYVRACFDESAGGFADRPGGKPDVPTTAVGLMAVVALKLPTEPYNDRGVAYLMKHAKGFEEIRIAAAGLEAVGARPEGVAAWREEIVKLRNPDGTFGKGAGLARATGGSVAALLRLGGEVENRPGVVAALKAAQAPDGGFVRDEKAKGSDLETTYRVTRAFHMLKEKPDAAKLRAFVATCRNADGGYGVAPGQPSTVAGTYYAGIIQKWLE